jgi:AAHS family 4-hydroxybenzoate transporter-like MFS transporter
MNPRIDVSQWIERQNIGRLQVLVVILSAACAVLEGFNTQDIGFVAPAVTHDWQLAPHSLTAAFMSGTTGLLIGCLAIAPLADQIGRKKVMVGSVIAFSCFSFLTATVHSPNWLILLRFLTGAGIGGGMPNAIALTSEFFSERKRPVMTVIMFTGFALGAALGGFLAAYLVPRFGWPSIFIAGGILPAVLAPFLVFVLPESVGHLVVHRAPPDRVAAILKRINPDAEFPDGARFVIPEERNAGFTVAHLFKAGRAAGTVLIWVIFFCSLLCIFLIASWLPTVLHDAGLSIAASSVITAMHQLSGVVTALLAAQMLERRGCLAILLPSYLLAAAGIAAIGSVGTSATWLTVAACAAGAGIVCGQLIANAFAAGFYPTYIRATGVGWALGIGRLGAIAGPGIGGLMLAMHWSRSTIFLVAAVPAIIAVLAVLALMWLAPSDCRSEAWSARPDRRVLTPPPA